MDLIAIEKKLGYVFANKELLLLAFVHRSFVNEQKGKALQHNERLEFLGDSVLGLVVSEYLYHRLPGETEGRLSQIRSHVIDAHSCAQYLQKLQVADAILLGRGEKMSEGHAKISIQADVFEALVAAIYLDGGFDAAKGFILKHFEAQMELVMASPSRNYKAELQDFSLRQFQKAPTYRIMEETGPDHAKMFHVSVFLGDREAGAGVGGSKKEAEQMAACDALAKMGRQGGSCNLK